jgi:hypothetical protein
VTRETVRHALVPLLSLVAIAVVAATLGYLTEGSGEGAGTDAAKAPSQGEAIRGQVRDLVGDQLTLTTPNGLVTLRLPAGSALEALRPVAPSSLTAGDWLNAGGVANPASIYTLIGLVVIPQALLEAPSP